jgi:hypothetical protein
MARARRLKLRRADACVALARSLHHSRSIQTSPAASSGQRSCPSPRVTRRCASSLGSGQAPQAAHTTHAGTRGRTRPGRFSTTCRARRLATVRRPLRAACETATHDGRGDRTRDGGHLRCRGLSFHSRMAGAAPTTSPASRNADSGRCSPNRRSCRPPAAPFALHWTAAIRRNPQGEAPPPQRRTAWVSRD